MMAKKMNNITKARETSEPNNHKVIAGKKFTRGQVAAHSALNDCWVIIDGKVYDLTQFLITHPGGSTPLLTWAGTGKDASEAFAEVGHSNMAIAMMRKYFIGSVQ